MSELRLDVDAALALLGGDAPDRLLRAGVDLQVLEDVNDEVFFVHQLLQEYFAARAVASASKDKLPHLAALAQTAWPATEVAPPVFESDNEPLPPAPQTGWEETFMLAAAMSPAVDAFVSGLADVNLPLAGRCAAQPDVRPKLTASLVAGLQHDLVTRSRHAAADLRARIAAARALGELDDPRFERRKGEFGAYLVPPMIAIPGGAGVVSQPQPSGQPQQQHRFSFGECFPHRAGLRADGNAGRSRFPGRGEDTADGRDRSRPHLPILGSSSRAHIKLGAPPGFSDSAAPHLIFD